MTYNYEISTFVQKTEILKYQIGECNNPLDYMRLLWRRFGKANRVVIIATRLLIF